ncbi:sensor histidine kinase [Pendulispora albinea]|uniref:Histidine kinase n=1 Tax=Pendulispora albinea TaxID=2741071 RepID=A0ABZ2M5Z4_9BACT
MAAESNLGMVPQTTQATQASRRAELVAAEGAGAMEPPAERTSRRNRVLFGSAVVLAAVLLQAGTQFFVIQDRARALIQFIHLAIEVPILMVALSKTHAWALRRQASPVRALIAGSLVAAAIGMVCTTILWFVTEQLGLRPHTFKFYKVVLFGFSFSQLYFGLWALAFVYPFAAEDARIRALEAEKLRSMADLSRLRAHLEPHFLLNTLNAIAGLVTEDPREARRLIACLGDLLRDALRDEHELQTLDEEVAWLKRYAAILEARHRGELVFQWQIESGLSNVLLPRLLLQPLVENAVKHGALRRKGGKGQVTVRALEDEAARVIFTIEDNGPGLSDRQRDGTFGLQSVQKRLRLRYPGAELRLTSSSAGTVSTVEIPRDALALAPAQTARKASKAGAS